MINAKQQSEAREERAKSILQIGSPETLDEFTYLVPSQFDSTKKYRVTHLDSYSCFKVFHNFVRKGVKDNLTPAERRGIGIKGNRWEAMLINSLKVPNATGGQKMAKSPAD